MKQLIVLAAALGVGFYLLSYDQRTDDTGVEAALLLATSLAFSGIGAAIGYAMRRAALRPTSS